MVATVLTTVLTNGLNLRLYVEWLLEQMPNAGAFTDEVVDGFLPWSASVPDSCRLEPDKAERARERASVGRTGCCQDNAVTESLMEAVKSECVHAETFEGHEKAALEIFEHVERSCNRARIHSAIGWMSPTDYEAGMSEKAAEAT